MLLLFENFQSWRNKILDKGYERNGVMSLLWNRFCYRSVLGISDNDRVFVWNERILVLMQKPDRFLKICLAFYLFTAKQICTKWRKRFVISPLRTSPIWVSFLFWSRWQDSNLRLLRPRSVINIVAYATAVAYAPYLFPCRARFFAHRARSRSKHSARVERFSSSRKITVWSRYVRQNQKRKGGPSFLGQNYVLVRS